jgi:hypothetical protein
MFLDMHNVSKKLKFVAIISVAFLVATGIVISDESLLSVSKSKQFAWGLETNGIAIALIPGQSQPYEIASKNAKVIVVLTNTTAIPLAFVLPQTPSRFDLEMFDADGNSVSRTKSGREIGKLLPAVECPYAFDRNGHQFDKARDREFLSPHSMDLFLTINLFDYFEIRNAGKYRVEYEQRFQISILQSNKVIWAGLVLPKAATTINIE